VLATAVRREDDDRRDTTDARQKYLDYLDVAECKDTTSESPDSPEDPLAALTMPQRTSHIVQFPEFKPLQYRRQSSSLPCRNGKASCDA
jgi:hypothetical protein